LGDHASVLLSRQKEADWLDQGDMADRYPIKCHKNENRALKLFKSCTAKYHLQLAPVQGSEM